MTGTLRNACSRPIPSARPNYDQAGTQKDSLGRGMTGADAVGTDTPSRSSGWVARRLGIAPATLRTWHHRYDVGPSERTPGGHRRYGEADLQRLERMHRLIRAGYPVAEAARVSAGPDSGTGRPAARARRGGGRTLASGAADAAVRALAADVLALDQSAVLEALAERLRLRGVAEAWNGLLLPVLGHIGRRYERFGDCVEAEHLFSECVRATLTAVVLRQRSWDDRRAPVLLAALDGEQHVLALHALAAALAERQVPSLALGASTPAPALGAAAQRVAPPAVFLWSQSAATADVTALARLPRRRPRTVVVLGGPGWRSVGLPHHVVRVHALADALSALETSGS